MEEVVHVDAEGQQLFGILHRPDPGAPVRDAGLVVVNSRVEYRLGPHRFAVEAARRWCREGFPVLRFDYPGNGDSPGDASYPTMDSFPVAPAAAAVAFLRREADVRQVALVGNCMGARNALFAGAGCPEVRHLILLGMPFSNATPFIRGEGGRVRPVSTDVARSTLRGYLRRLGDPEAWRRLVTGKSELRVIGASVAALFGGGHRAVYQEPVYRSLHDFFSRGGRALVVYGTQDIFLPDFEAQIRRVRHRLPAFGDRADIRYVEGGNHTLSRMAWKDDAIEHTADWLVRELPVIVPGARSPVLGA